MYLIEFLIGAKLRFVNRKLDLSTNSSVNQSARSKALTSDKNVCSFRKMLLKIEILMHFLFPCILCYFALPYINPFAPTYVQHW